MRTRRKQPSTFKGIRNRGRSPKIIVENEEEDSRYYHFNTTIIPKGEMCEFGIGMPLREADGWDKLSLEGKNLCDALWEIEGLEWYDAAPNYIRVSRSPAYSWQSVDSKILKAITETLFATLPKHIRVQRR